VSSRRDTVLAEMGLAPLWRLKAAKASSSAEKPGWQELRQLVPGCTACALHKSRTQTVFGVGDERADWMLIGEAPGAEEDRLGEPFVGQAGKLLDNMLAAIGLKRGENVYIANVLKCRPPGEGWIGCGSGFAAFPDMAARLGVASSFAELHPAAAAIARLAAPRLARGEGVDASAAAPRYLRDKVAFTRDERGT
jgi:hypothetical protein